MYKLMIAKNKVTQKCEVCHKKINRGRKIYIVGEIIACKMSKLKDIWNTWGKCCSKLCIDDLVYSKYYKDKPIEDSINQFKSSNICIIIYT